MKHKSNVLIVKDMDVSKSFYRNILGLHVLFNYHGQVILSGGIVLQSYEIWKDLIRKTDDEIVLQNHANELYFEIDDIDDFMQKLNENNVPLIHPLKQYAWGQRVVRFYDPDGHVIAVGETLRKVAKHFISQGLSYDEIAKIMNLPVDSIRKMNIS